METFRLSYRGVLLLRGLVVRLFVLDSEPHTIAKLCRSTLQLQLPINRVYESCHLCRFHDRIADQWTFERLDR